MHRDVRHFALEVADAVESLVAFVRSEGGRANGGAVERGPHDTCRSMNESGNTKSPGLISSRNEPTAFDAKIHVTPANVKRQRRARVDRFAAAAALNSPASLSAQIFMKISSLFNQNLGLGARFLELNFEYKSFRVDSKSGKLPLRLATSANEKYNRIIAFFAAVESILMAEKKRFVKSFEFFAIRLTVCFRRRPTQTHIGAIIDVGRVDAVVAAVAREQDNFDALNCADFQGVRRLAVWRRDALVVRILEDSL